MGAPIDPYTLRRAKELADRGIPLQQVADTLGVSRASLYLYGIRSARGYIRSA